MPVRVRPHLVTVGQYSAAHGLRLDRLLPLASRAKELNVTPLGSLPPAPPAAGSQPEPAVPAASAEPSAEESWLGPLPVVVFLPSSAGVGSGKEQAPPHSPWVTVSIQLWGKRQMPKVFPLTAAPRGWGCLCSRISPLPHAVWGGVSSAGSSLSFPEILWDRLAEEAKALGPEVIRGVAHRHNPSLPVVPRASCPSASRLSAFQGPRYCPALGRDLKRSHASHQRTKHRAQWIAPRMGQRRDPASPRESFRQGVSFGPARPPPLCTGGTARKALPRRPREDVVPLAGELSPIPSREVGWKGSSMGRVGWVLGAGGYTGRTNPPHPLPKIASIKLTGDTHEEQKLTRGPLSQRHSPYCPLQASWDPTSQSQNPPLPAPALLPPLSLPPEEGREEGGIIIIPFIVVSISCLFLTPL
nr:uncharacterized protein LOC116831479 [Chelonoidis abingdonii]XP_032647401.1 uncharacterized protein LOC116831479 [Chelonoidis abingdonii]